jgi:Galactose-3-O-sulfotransferase
MKAGRARGVASTRQGQRREGPLTVFIHIPKTAGSTFAAVLRDNFAGGVHNLGNVYMGSGGFHPRTLGRLRDAPALRTRGIEVLTGHLPFAVRERLAADTRYITFLRDPIERTLSQYHGLLKPNRRRSLPGDGSLEAVLSDGEVIFDNLQTRMLSDVAEPCDVDDRMLEQAKHNLRSGFTAFGLAERFDESLVLFKRLLGLRTIVYVQRRVSTRPRGSEVPEESVRIAERFNRFDAELYRWARDTFEQSVADEDIDFAADVAALRAARGGDMSPAPPEAVDRGELWELLVRTRCELLVERRELARSAPATDREVRDLLAMLHKDVAGLGKRAPERPSGKANARGRRPDRLAARAAEVAALAADAATRLEEVNERIRAIDGAGSEGASSETVRLRREAAQLGRRIEQLTSRAAHLQEKLRRLSGGEGQGAAAAGG